MHPTGGLGQAPDVGLEKLCRRDAKLGGEGRELRFTYLGRMVSNLLRACRCPSRLDRVGEGVATVLY